MFTHLVVSNPRRVPGTGSVVATTGSILFHSALMALGVILTTKMVAAPRTMAVVPSIVFPTDPRVPAETPPPDIPILGAPLPIAMPALLPPVEVPQGIPPVDLTSPVVPTGRWTGAPAGDLFGQPTGTGLTSAVLSTDVVDERPELLNRPRVHYPSILLRAGVEGRVTLRFVVDTAGRVERNSLEALETSHAAFTKAAEDVILRSRFRAGRLRGKPVRVLVVQSVVFRIERPSSNLSGVAM